MFGVPASNLYGISFQVERSRVTVRIMSPPPMNGCMVSSTSIRPQSTPTPVGPSILCAEKARKSQPSSCTSTGRWGTLCAPSMSTSAPWSCASRVSSRTGTMVPSAFDMCVTLSSFVRSVISFRASSRSSVPSGSMGMNLSTMPRSSRSSCHGTMFEWCSISESTTSSPSRRCARAQPCATRLIDSVVLRVKMISRSESAWMKSRTCPRTRSYCSVASCESACTPRWMLELESR